MSKYFFTDGEEKYGPFSKEELHNKNLSRDTKLWCYGMEKWTELSKLPDLKDLLSSIPPELKSKPSKEDKKQNVELQSKSNPEKETKTTPPPLEKKKISNIGKWLVAVVVITLVSIFAYSVIQNQSNVNQYNEIVANAYDSDEDFDMYVQKFYRDLKFYGIYPKKPKVQIIKFSKLDQLDNTTHIHGLSFGSDDDDRIEIYINPSTWQQFNKPMRYFLMYHELAHDVLNLDDLEAKSWNEEKLMYPAISSYENKNMDDFIESSHAVFEKESE